MVSPVHSADNEISLHLTNHLDIADDDSPLPVVPDVDLVREEQSRPFAFDLDALLRELKEVVDSREKDHVPDGLNLTSDNSQDDNDADDDDDDDYTIHSFGYGHGGYAGYETAEEDELDTDYSYLQHDDWNDENIASVLCGSTNR